MKQDHDFTFRELSLLCECVSLQKYSIFYIQHSLPDGGHFDKKYSELVELQKRLKQMLYYY